MKFKSGLFSSLLLFVLLPTAAFSQMVSIEAGTDRMGGDYKSFALESAQPALCQQACADDAACKAYTYAKPGVKGPRAMCFLKSNASASTPNACCTSGARAAGGGPSAIVRQQPQALPQATPPQTGVRRIEVRPMAPPPAPEVEFLIPAPSTATAVSDLSEHEVRWAWNAIGCFPGGPGSVPKPCPFVKDIEGFKVYSIEGGLRQTIQNPGARDAALGKQAGKCYYVTAFKGDNESAPSPVGCVDAPAKPLFKMSQAIPTPGNLRSTNNAADCAAATHGSALLCDAVLKSNAQVLLWEHNGNGIDGFRVYDAVQGIPLVIKTEANPKIRLFAIQPRKGGVVLSDFCFTVRAYKGDTESLPSNPVCLTPKGPAPAPVKPLLLIGPSSGIATGGVQSLRNQNSGCPLPQRLIEVRGKNPLPDDGMSVYWIHRDNKSLCGKHIVIWNEGSIMFPLDAIPSDFKSVELRFTSRGSVAFLGTDGPFHKSKHLTLNVNCIQSLHAYHITLKDNNAFEKYQYGEPNAYFSWIKEELVATETLPNTTHRFDVTALVKKSLAAGKPNLGFVWEVNKNMAGDNDMCITSFEGFALEVKQK